MSHAHYSFLALVIAVAALGLAFIALSQGEVRSDEDTLSRIQETGEINVCHGIWPPAVIRDAETGELSGHDIDIVKGIFGPIDVEPVFIEQAWGNMVAGLQSGRCDVALTLFAKIPRAAVISFSRPMYYSGQGVIAEASEDRFTNPSDLNNPDVRIAVATGESGHLYAEEYLPDAEIVALDTESSDYSRIFTEVVAGRADVAIGDYDTVVAFAEQQPGLTNLFANPFGLSGVTIATRQEDDNLLQFLNTSLEYLEVNGRIKEFEDRYDATRIHEITTYELR